MIVRRLARPLLASVFISGGVETLRNPKPQANRAEPVIDDVADRLESDTQPTASTPRALETEQFVKANAAVQIGAGALLAVGKLPRLSSVALAATLVPTTAFEHRFWELSDGPERDAQRVHFMKNVALLGGLILASVDTEGRPDLIWRAKHARDESKVVTAATAANATMAAKATKANARAAKRVAAAEAGVIGEEARSRAKELRKEAAKAAKKARKEAEAVAKVARKEATKAAKVARKESKSLKRSASKRAAELADTAGPKLADWADTASNMGHELAEVAGPKLAGFAETASAKGQELGEVAGPRLIGVAETASTKGREVAESMRRAS